MACQMSVMTLLPLYWRQHHLSDAEVGWLAAGFSLAAIGARAWLGGWLETHGRRAFLYLGALLLTALPLAYPNWGLEFLPWMVLRLLQGAGYGFYITAILTWVADRSPSDRIAQRQGVFGVSGLLGSAIGPVTAEAAADAGLAVDGGPGDHTLEGMVRDLADYYGHSGRTAPPGNEFPG